MNLAPDDDLLLRALVKTSRQRTVHLKWTDRDGTARVTALLPAEATRVNALAHSRRISAEALMREAAHLPAAPKPAQQTPAPAASSLPHPPAGASSQR